MTSLRERTLVLAGGEFVNTGLTALLAVVLTRVLTKDAYGTYRQVLLIYALLAAVVGSHLAESLLYFLPRSSRENRPRWLGQTTVLSLGVGVLLGAGIYASAGLWARFSGNPELLPVLRVFALFPLADRIVRLVSPALVATDRARAAAGFTIVAAGSKILAAVVPAILGWSLAALFWTANGTWIVLAAGGLFLVARHVGFDTRPPGAASLREQFSYVVPLMGGWLVGTLQEQLGQLVAARAFSVVEYAEYAVGAGQLPLVGIWTASIASAMMPDLVRLAGEDRRADMLALWHRGARKGALLIFPLTALALVVPDHAIRLLYGAPYARAVVPFAIFLLALPARVTNYSLAFRALGRTRAMLVWTTAGLVVNLGVTLALVVLGRGTLAFAGPAIGYVAGYYATVAVVVFMLHRLMNVRVSHVLPLRQLAPLAALSIVSGLVASLVRFTPLERVTSNGAFVAALYCALAALALAACYVGLGLSVRIFDEGERRLLRGLLGARKRTA